MLWCIGTSILVGERQADGPYCPGLDCSAPCRRDFDMSLITAWRQAWHRAVITSVTQKNTGWVEPWRAVQEGLPEEARGRTKRRSNANTHEEEGSGWTEWQVRLHLGPCLASWEKRRWPVYWRARAGWCKQSGHPRDTCAGDSCAKPASAPSPERQALLRHEEAK